MLVAMLTLALLLQATAAAPAPAAKAPSEIVAAAPASDWVDIAANDLLVMHLAPDPQGKPRRVLIQLMPPPFSRPWIENIRTLAKAHWWDGTAVTRVQDNYVTQWGDPTEKKVLPSGLTKTSEDAYQVEVDARSSVSTARDAYADIAGFMKGFPVASAMSKSWPIHCYGMVGVGRGMSPDAGTGAELYTVIGHAPRHLDRNIAVVGRVVEGIEHLSSLPRGTGPLGVYEDAKQHVPVASIRLASELPEPERPRMQYLSTESATFAAYAEARANRHDAFFIVPAGGADICNIPVPVRRRP
jgi:peptidylprolyl isomerase